MLRRPSADTRWLVFTVGLGCLGVYLVLILLLGGIGPNRWAILFDLVLFLAGFLFWIFFFSQFTLPIQKPSERLRSALRLLLYLLGLHGPAVRIEDGRVVQREEETRKHGPGVLIVDAASAAVLRTGHAFTRPVGPGVHFLHYDRRRRSGEYIAGVVDLRPQRATAGPVPREDPFAPRHRQEPPEVYKLRQDRRWETSGLTRDGIEAVPSLSVTFRIDSGSQKGAGLGYNPVAVWRAVTAEGVDPTAPAGDAHPTVSWEWLPSRLAVDVWREYLRMFTLEALFNDSTAGQTGFEIIAELLRRRLTQPRVLELDEFGRPSGRQIASPEFALLARRGLRVLSVSITNLRLPTEVEEQLTRRWESTWLVRAREEQEALERLADRAPETGRIQALREHALSAAHALASLPGGEQPDDTTLAEALLEGTLHLLERDPELFRRGPDEKTALLDLTTRIHGGQ